MNLSTIAKHVINRKFHLLKRTNAMKKKYIEHQKTVLKEWISMEDYIKARYLDYPVYNHFALRCLVGEQPNLRYSLQYNPFPYNIAKEVYHMILWSNIPLDMTMVSRILNDEMTEQNYVCVEMPEAGRSIPDVWHVHVFVQE